MSVVVSGLLMTNVASLHDHSHGGQVGGSLPTKGLLCGMRAASLGGVGFVLALVAHVAAGGVAPGLAVLLLLAGVIALAAVLLTRVRLSPLRIAMSLAAMQVVLHEVFMWLGSTPASCVMTGMTGGHMGQGAQPVVECATGMAHSGMAQRSVSTAAAMVGAHVAATAVMAALLAYGEKAPWFLAGWVRPSRWLRMGLPDLLAVRVVSSGAPRMFRVLFACGGVGRRGPPPRGLFAIG